MRSPHRCAARACRIEIPRGVLMCRPHWKLVPKDLQARVWRTWKALLASPSKQTTRAWALAVGAARSAVEEKEATMRTAVGTGEEAT